MVTGGCIRFFLDADKRGSNREYIRLGHASLTFALSFIMRTHVFTS